MQYVAVAQFRFTFESMIFIMLECLFRVSTGTGTTWLASVVCYLFTRHVTPRMLTDWCRTWKCWWLEPQNKIIYFLNIVILIRDALLDSAELNYEGSLVAYNRGKVMSSLTFLWISMYNDETSGRNASPGQTSNRRRDAQKSEYQLTRVAEGTLKRCRRARCLFC